MIYSRGIYSVLAILMTVTAFIFFYSCGSSTKISTEISILSPKKISSAIAIDDYIDQITYIPLGVKENVKIGPIDDFILADSLFIIKSISHETKLFVFNESGAYLHTIELFPEIRSISSISYDDTSKIIYISDKFGKKIIYFSVALMRVIDKHIFSDHFPDKIHFSGSHLLMSSSNRQDNIENGYIKEFDVSKKKIRNQYLKGPDFLNYIPSVQAFWSVGDTTFILYSFGDTIASYINGDFNTEALILDKTFTPLSNIKSEIIDLFMETRNRPVEIENALIPRGILMSNNDLVFIPLFDDSFQTLIWERKQGRSILIEPKTIKGLELINFSFLHFFQVDDKNWLYSSILLDPQFLDAANKYVSTHNNTMSTALLRLLTEFDSGDVSENPVIVKYQSRRGFFNKLTNEESF